GVPVGGGQVDVFGVGDRGGGPGGGGAQPRPAVAWKDRPAGPGQEGVERAAAVGPDGDGDVAGRGDPVFEPLDLRSAGDPPSGFGGVAPGGPGGKALQPHLPDATEHGGDPGWRRGRSPGPTAGGA